MSFKNQTSSIAKMICNRCKTEFSDEQHLGVPLTIVCCECATSSDLITKTDALSLGASQSDLSSLRRRYASNPYYRNGADMQLFVREEVDVFVALTAEKRRRTKEEAERKRVAADRRQQNAKKARIESLAKRMQGLDGIVPTPGLVAGDFCTTESKNPKVGVRSVLARRALWNRLSGLETPQKVRFFEWAVANKMLSLDLAGLEERVENENHLLDRVATVEGHRILSYLDEVDRLVLLRLKPVFSEQVNNLPVEKLSCAWVSLCDKVAGVVNLPFGRVLTKLRDCKSSWIGMYMFVVRPERVAHIMAPHFHAASKRNRLLKLDQEESFRRWGLSDSDKSNRADSWCEYFRGDVVDVELYSATCAILKAAIPPTVAVAAITKKVMSTPGATWMAVTKEHIQDQLVIRRETELMRKEDKQNSGKYGNIFNSICECGNPAAKDCVFGRCGCCCRGPCARHRR